MIRYSLFYPYLHYGAAFWSKVSKNYFEKVFLKQKKVIRYSLFYPYLYSGAAFWSNVSKDYFEKVFLKQKKVIRYIAGVRKYAHTEPLFGNLGILKLIYVKNLEVSKLIFSDLDTNRIFNFRLRSTVHTHFTRNNATLDLPQPRINLFRNSIFFNGLKYFDNLPIGIKNSTSNDIFKIRLKSYLIYFYDNG